MKAELTNSGSAEETHALLLPPVNDGCLHVNTCKPGVYERLTTQPVDGSLRSDALMLGARCPGDVEQRSQEVTGGCCVQDAT